MIWKDKQDVHTLTNMHRPSAEGNFCDEHGRSQRYVTVEDYSCHKGYTDKGDKTPMQLVREHGSRQAYYFVTSCS
jgi:hypothetical protein